MELKTCLSELGHVFDDDSLVLLIGIPLARIMLLFEDPELVYLLLSHDKIFTREHSQILLILALGNR